MKKLLSKSSVNLYLQCPFKWKCVYIDKIQLAPNEYQERGTNIHEKIENFYKDIRIIEAISNETNKKEWILDKKSDKDLDNFIRMENKRLNDCIDEDGKINLKYFKPIFQELKLQDEKLGLKGIIDAVYINPSDDGAIVIDWKTGKFDENKLDDYRFELAVYAELLRASNKTDNIKYWGIYFSDADRLFFEQIDLKYIINMYNIVNKVKQEIEKEHFQPRSNKYCYNCQFKEKCKKINPYI